MSNQRHWCKYCNLFIQPNPSSIKSHEGGWTHKNNVNRYLSNQKKEKFKKQKEDNERQRELKQMQESGSRSFQEKDYQAMQQQQLIQQQLEFMKQNQMMGNNGEENVNNNNNINSITGDNATPLLDASQYGSMEEYQAAYYQYYQHYYQQYYYGNTSGDGENGQQYTQEQLQYYYQQMYQQGNSEDITNQGDNQEQKQKSIVNNNNNNNSNSKNNKNTKKNQPQSYWPVQMQQEPNNTQPEDDITESDRKLIEKKLKEYKEQTGKDLDLSNTNEKEENGNITNVDTNTGLGGWETVAPESSMFGSSKTSDDDDDDNQEPDQQHFKRKYEDDEDYGDESSGEETIDMNKRVKNNSGSSTVGIKSEIQSIKSITTDNTLTTNAVKTEPPAKISFSFGKKQPQQKSIRKINVEIDN